jgi:prostaglandin-H2 D-isomerase / glutathione transferase
MSVIPKLKLSYFDFDGGRGEAVRLALTIAKVPFEDERLSREGFAARVRELPYGALPVLYVDGKPLAQSNAICRYVGKLTDLYPSDPWQAALCDEILDTVEEVTMHIGSTMSMDDQQKKDRRLKLVAETLPALLGGLEQRLKLGGGEFFVNNRMSVADLKASDLVGWLRSGMLDHIPTDFMEKVAPSLRQHNERVTKDPRISAYYANRAKISSN